ncbi:MAG: hypothetical protein KAS32_14755, partial [Candidatus Peribacteraceae bacterium]|nr:hypothetical protein [Candidatus Peribacteraceae bacterium]
MKKQNILNALGFLIDMSIDRHNDEQKYDKFAHDNIKKTLDLFDTLPKRTRAELLSWRQLTQLVIQLENDIVDNPEVTDLLQLILSEATGQTKTTPHKVVPGA